jgi:alkanesulfonate monooxygenase SsuD/methylene tetrahydromethanopterin reductase-like flavin-dependent oxidoreductase (luciferase family)
MLKRLAGVDLETMIASKTPTVLVGSPAAMIEQLQAARETLGLSYVIVNGQAAPWFAPVVERLAGSS